MRAVVVIASIGVAACVARSSPVSFSDGDASDTADGNTTGGDTTGGDTTGGDPAIDYHDLSPAAWSRIEAELDAAAAQGVSGPETATLIGPNFGTTEKWVGGVLAPNGKIYCLPVEASRVLEIDPTVEPVIVQEVGDDLSGSAPLAMGGVLAPDGRIYSTVFDRGSVLVIDPSTEPITTTVYDAGFTPPTDGYWAGVVLGRTGFIYGIPYNGTDILVIEPGDPPTFRRFGDLTAAARTGTHRWGLGALSPHNGRIYAMAFQAHRVIEIDPEAETVVEVGPSFPGDQWFGAIVGRDGAIYGMPDNRELVLRVDTSAGSAVITTFAAPEVSSDDGVIAPNGLIYSIPWARGEILAIDPIAQSATTALTVTLSTAGEWAGGVLAANGRIYGVPSFGGRVLELDPHANGTLPMWVLLSGYFNKY